MQHARWELKKDGTKFETALHALLATELAKIKRIIFNGDGYSADWHAEAKSRGLLNLANSLDAIAKLTDDKNVKLFERYAILTEREMESRAEIAVETYFKTVNIEGEMTAEMARTIILPAAVRYLDDLLDAYHNYSQLVGNNDRGRAKGLGKLVEDLNGTINELVVALDSLEAQNAELGGDTAHSKAHHMRDHVIPAMREVRTACDRLERMVPHDLWPLPRYREMLFVR